MTYVPFSVSRFPWKCIPLHCALVFVVMRVTQHNWKTQHLRQKDKLSFAFRILAFSALGTMWKGLKDEGVKISRCCSSSGTTEAMPAQCRAQTAAQLNNPTQPIFQHLLSLCLWWNVFQDANPKVRTPEPCTHPSPLLCGPTKEASVLYPPRTAISSCPPAKLSTGYGNNST